MSYNTLSRKPCYRLSTPVRLGVVAVAACFLAAPVLSNPVNPTVVNGVATFNQVGNVLTVTNSNGAIINWDKFSIKVGETTHFAQTSASSSVLNRVLNDPTSIYGTLSSNGRVWLVNPAGIMVGAGGRVDVAGFVASTLNISNADFLAGRNLFVNDGTAKDVINQGQITTPAGGSVYLIGSNVSNEGIITTPQGETILAAGATVSLIDSALPGVKVDITGAEGNSTNLGTITAEAGRIGIAGVIVRNSGTLNASSVVEEGGRIFLKASKDAYVDGNGRIVTTGTKGGSVEVLGDRVAVMDNAEIDASGVNGGGTIKIGGDYQGKNPDIQNASITYLGHNASLKADATEVGDGGTVIVWADDTTRAYGNISARGGATAGNGGFVEVSGKQTLDFAARVNTLAPHGKTGTLLLDPGSLFIDDTIWASFYQGLGTDLILQTDSSGTGNIDFSGSGAYNTFGHNLKVLAYGAGSSVGNITFTDFRLAVVGDLTLTAGWDGASTATPVSVPTKGDIVMSGSTWGTGIQAVNMDVQAGNNLTLTGGSGSGSGSFGPGVMLYSTGAQTITVGNQILLTAGSFNNTAHSGWSQYGGSVVIEALGNQSVSADTIKLWAGTAGHDNVAAIRGGGATQNITVTTLLDLKGGGGGDDNYANIHAYGTGTVQSIDATGANIVLTGGTSGGMFDHENGADMGLGQFNTTGSQTVYAGSITITGGSAAYGGAGFGNEHGLNQSFFVTGDLTMTGGSANNADFRATPAYIGSENGGGTIYMEVGGDITLTGGSGTAGGVLIGSLSDWDGPTTINLSAGKDIVATGNTGGVWLGIKSLDGGEGSGVALTAGTNSSFGGNIEMVGPGGVYIQTDADGGSVSLTAYNSSAGAKGNITQNSASAISSGDVMFLAEGSATFDGSITASTGSYALSNGSIKGTAGIACPDGCNSSIYGGSLSFGSTSTILAEGDIVLESSRDITVNGLMTSLTGDVTIAAGGYRYSSGYSPGQYSSPFGGNVFIGSTGVITADSNVNITANVGYGIYVNGNITQYSSSAIIGGNNVSIIAGGSVSLGGIVTASSGGLLVQAGYQAGDFNDGATGVTPYGGDITLTSGSFLSGGNGVQLKASNGGSGYGYMGGNILQMAGSTIYSGGYSDIAIVSAGNTTLNGTVSAGYQLEIGAGLDPLDSNSSSGIGGDITFGSGSVVRARNDVDGTAVKAVTSGGYLNDGHIIQAAGSQLLVDSYGDVEALAYGDARMDGTTSIAYGGYGIYVNAGAANLGGLSSFYDDGIWGGSNIVSIGSFSAIGGHVEVKAAGAILRSASNLNGINIAADTVSLTSVYGGLAGGIAISAFTEATGSITAEVVSGASYGGISIQNFGVQPGTISLTDDASNPGTGLNSQPMSISFYNSGDLFVDTNTEFFTNNSGDMAITSGGNLNYISGLGSIDGGLLLGADGNLAISTSLSTVGDLKLSAGGVLDVDWSIDGIDGYNIELGAPTININANVTAANNAALIAPLAGGTINLNAGVTAGGTSATPSYINGIAYSGIAIIAQDVIADGSSAYLDATSVSGDISGLVSGNITLDNGAYFQAGNDIDLVLAGSTSTLSLSNGSYFLADYVTQGPFTIFLDFLARSSGGVMIDGVATTTSTPGGSGFFVVDTDTPAREGFGLEIKYASNAATDPCAISPTLCKGPDFDPYRPPPKPDKDKDKKASCEEGSFGCEENQANDGKKDEKPGEKKVAQCSL